MNRLLINHLKPNIKTEKVLFFVFFKTDLRLENLTFTLTLHLPQFPQNIPKYNTDAYRNIKRMFGAELWDF